MGNFSRCCFVLEFIFLALRKCKNDCKISKSIMVQVFCSLKTENGQFPIGFRLNICSIN